MMTKINLLFLQQNRWKMKKIFEFLSESELFMSMDAEQIKSLLPYLNARELEFDKGSLILSEGESAGNSGIILSGGVYITSEDYYGNRSITAEAGPGEMFAEVFASAGVSHMPVSVFAAENSRILLLDLRAVTGGSLSPVPGAETLAVNLLRIVSRKTLLLNRKIHILSRRTTREKLLAYLSYHAQISKSSCFDIPFDRQELADFLCVDRSAMSAELSRMKKDGLIKYHKNHFRLL